MSRANDQLAICPGRPLAQTSGRLAFFGTDPRSQTPRLNNDPLAPSNHERATADEPNEPQPLRHGAAGTLMVIATESQPSPNTGRQGTGYGGGAQSGTPKTHRCQRPFQIPRPLTQMTAIATSQMASNLCAWGTGHRRLFETPNSYFGGAAATMAGQAGGAATTATHAAPIAGGMTSYSLLAPGSPMIPRQNAAQPAGSLAPFNGLQRHALPGRQNLIVYQRNPPMAGARNRRSWNVSAAAYHPER